MGYRHIVVEGRGGYDPQEPIESWELKGTKSNGVGESLVMSDDKMHKFNKLSHSKYHKGHSRLRSKVLEKLS